MNKKKQPMTTAEESKSNHTPEAELPDAEMNALREDSVTVLIDMYSHSEIIFMLKTLPDFNFDQNDPAQAPEAQAPSAGTSSEDLAQSYGSQMNALEEMLMSSDFDFDWKDPAQAPLGTRSDWTRILASAQLQLVGLSPAEAENAMTNTKLAILAITHPKDAKRKWRDRKNYLKRKKRKADRMAEMKTQKKTLETGPAGMMPFGVPHNFAWNPQFYAQQLQHLMMQQQQAAQPHARMWLQPQVQLMMPPQGQCQGLIPPSWPNVAPGSGREGAHATGSKRGRSGSDAPLGGDHAQGQGPSSESLSQTSTASGLFIVGTIHFN